MDWTCLTTIANLRELISIQFKHYQMTTRKEASVELLVRNHNEKNFDHLQEEFLCFGINPCSNMLFISFLFNGDSSTKMDLVFINYDNIWCAKISLRRFLRSFLSEVVSNLKSFYRNLHISQSNGDLEDKGFYWFLVEFVKKI